MLNLYSTDHLDVQRYYELLTKKGFIYVDLERLRDDVIFMDSRSMSLGAVTTRYMRVMHSTLTPSLTPDSVYEFLVDGCGVDPSRFRSKNARGWSIADDKLSRLADKKIVADFLDLYQAHKSTKTKKGLLAGILNRATRTDLKSRDGNELGKVYFDVQQRQNLRFYYKQESIIQIPKAMSECVTVPDGYFIVWGDFASADMIAALNCYLIETDRDKEIAALHGRDGYAIFAHLIADYYGEPFDEEEFKQNRSAYKLYALKTIYGNTHGANEEESLFIKRATPFLQSRKRYMQYINNIARAYNVGLALEIERYFGTTEYLDRTPENSSLVEVTDKALNTPIQTHTSERIIALVLSVVDDFAKLGYVYGDDFWVYYVRHDEPLFVFKEKMLQDMWVLADNGEIQVDDGIVQYVDWIYGYNYKLVDDELQTQASKVYEENQSRLRPPIPKQRPNEYMPVRDVLVTGVSMLDLANDLVVAMYIENNNTVAYKKYEGLAGASASRRLDVLQDIYLNKLNLHKLGSPKSVMVYNEMTCDPLYQDGVYYVMQTAYERSLLKARALCDWTCSRIANRDGIFFESQHDFTDSALSDLRRVGVSDVLI